MVYSISTREACGNPLHECMNAWNTILPVAWMEKEDMHLYEVFPFTQSPITSQSCSSSSPSSLINSIHPSLTPTHLFSTLSNMTRYEISLLLPTINSVSLLFFLLLFVNVYHSGVNDLFMLYWDPTRGQNKPLMEVTSWGKEARRQGVAWHGSYWRRVCIRGQEDAMHGREDSRMVWISSIYPICQPDRPLFVPSPL